MDENTRITRQKNESETEKNITKSGVSALTREIEYLRKQTESEKTDILNLIRDRDMMQKYIKKAEEENTKSKDEISRLKNDITMYKE
jgi:cupin superfamily acireductone dioxygenase involved in methionine salvage